MRFKTLINKRKEDIESFGRYAQVFGKSLGSGEIPKLMGNNVTINMLESMYPDVNFDNVELIDIIMEESNEDMTENIAKASWRGQS